ncbi:MAG: HAD-IC family P-type ATPase [Succiniclasticum sp.]|uniref:HAD-IC family P-type ATPase n=1 Tax=Succiniclasticum sp. TaxID=2775030 RepID=UPI002A914940|nr:HAD-IC family P-type ATPase [Succiniclasticum sp.]MDY6290639.1 HAD-IC family P-type ATPase [Succiniclasticum sp.]
MKTDEVTDKDKIMDNPVATEFAEDGNKPVDPVKDVQEPAGNHAEADRVVQEVDTSAINATEKEELPQPKRRQRPKRKSRFVAGQISRLKLAVLFLIPLLMVSIWTEIAPLLAEAGLCGVLFDLPGAYRSVNARGLLQLLLLAPVLYAGRQFYVQALEDLQERIPSAEVLLLIGTVASVAGGLYTAVKLLLGVPYAALPPLFLAYTGVCVAASLCSVYMDRWCKAPMPQFLDLPSMGLVSGSILLSIIACLSFFYTDRAAVPVWQIALSIFICCSPALFMLAPSLAAFVAVTKAAEHQILLRDGTVLSDAGETTLVIFDKTGTLTIGRPVLSDIHIFHNGSETGILGMAAAMLQDSDMPEAAAVREAAEGCRLPVCTEIRSTPEGWHTARCFRENIRIGSLEFVGRYARIPAETNAYVEQLSDAGKTVWYLSVGRTLYAIFGFSDELREETPEAMRRLKDMGITTSVMTGDNKRAGLYLGRLSGAERVAAELLPTHKAQLVQTFRKGGEVVAVVGDGDNDAPALEYADFGFAVGSGTKAVWKAAQVVLTDNDLRNVAATFQLSRDCVETVKRNVRAACIFNLLLLPFGTGIASLFGGPVLRPWMLLAATLLAAALLVVNTWKLKRWGQSKS